MRYILPIVFSLIIALILIGCENDENPIQPTPFSLKVVYPNGGESFRVTDTVAVSWESGGLGWDTLGTQVRLFLIKSDRRYKDLGSFYNSGLAMWIISRYDAPLGDNYKIRVQHSIEASIWDESDLYFSIY